MNEKDILIINNISKKLEEIKKDGVKNLVIISDFDFTLTHRFNYDKSPPEQYLSSFGTLERSDLMSSEFKTYTINNYNHYSPKEYDLSLSLEERTSFMQEWTEKGLNAVVNEKITLSFLNEITEKAISSNQLKIRKSAEKLFHFAAENLIPFYVLSAGCGNVIERFLEITIDSKVLKVLKENNLLVIVSNFFEVNENNQIVSFKKPVLNTFNKVDFLKQAFRHDSLNAIVFGDHHHDSFCVEKLTLNKTISIAFVNFDKKEMETNKKDILERYLLHWDVIKFNEGSFELGVEIMKSIQ